MWQPALRILIQLLLVAPVLLFSPFAVALAVTSLPAVVTLDPEHFVVA